MMWIYLLIWLICIPLAYSFLRYLWDRDFGPISGRGKIVISLLSLFGPITLVFDLYIYVVMNCGRNVFLNRIGKFLDRIGKFLP